MQHYDYLGIGAGPVGLATAIHFKIAQKLQGKDVSVVILDKREDYVRGHTVYLDPSVLKTLVFKVDDLVEGHLSGIVERYNKAIRALSGNTPIKKIESTLSQFASDELNIEIKRGEIYKVSNRMPLNEFVQAYTPKIVVAAGGYHCAASNEVFGKADDRRAVDKKDLTYMLKAKFKVEERPQKGQVEKFVLMGKTGRFVSNAWYGKKVDNDGMYRGQAFATATKAEVDVIESLPAVHGKPGTYKNPLTSEDLGNGSDSAKASGLSLNLARKAFDREFRALNAKDLEIVIIRLGAYRSEEYIGVCGEVPVVMMGDASAGVPFQRSLCGSYSAIVHTSKLFDTLIVNPNNDMAKKEFKQEVDAIWDKEIQVAVWKARGLYLVDCIASMIRAVFFALVAFGVGYGLYALRKSAQKKWRAVDGKI